MTDSQSKRDCQSNLLPTLILLFVLVMMAFLAACQTLPLHSPVNEGKMIFSARCVACHGALGRGDGYVLFNPPVADLTSKQVQKKLDVTLFKTIHEGRPNTAMGAWRVELSDGDVWNVIQYVRHLGTENGSLSEQ